ncbi:MAG: dTDP-4-dehydrorhamnose 3,5-epimerase family protein [Halobacteriovoraceae bacterium]|nr:dTDP-4-dehydrorhamnose 3,5-epimerase family protein [Halobacteriovoraceae bacterium]MBT5095819.1 dTDP-4-dehydrorhamnose 3,5-epimerase family protein [Halobacteriovoraceae bacterium]
MSIENLIITPLKKIVDERGSLLHMLRADSPQFTKFGEVYFSTINPGVIKGWKLHTLMTQNYAVPVGEIKLVIYDVRENSSSKGQIQELSLSLENYQLVTIPPGVWYAFKATSDNSAMIVNCTDLSHDPSESQNLDLNSEDIPYKWE